MVHALIFDMDGTMIDSMPSHKRSWAEFAQRQGLDVDISDVMRRTTGRTGIECMRILFGRPEMGEDEAMAHVHVKEAVYRELFSPIFAEVAGFKAFFDHAHARGLKLGVGTAGDRQNRLTTPKALSIRATRHVRPSALRSSSRNPVSTTRLRDRMPSTCRSRMSSHPRM